MNTVYCYYEEIGFGSPARLLNLWADSWQKRGWKPVILSESVAKQSRYYFDVLSAAKRLPTVNHAGYSLANYLRYCALESVGGGLLTDYDCINYAFTPDNGWELLRRPFARLHIGGFISLTGDYPGIFCDGILNMHNHIAPSMKLFGRPHVSDVEVQDVVVGPMVGNLCCLYREYNWQSYPVVHYSNDSIAGLGDKVALIQRERPI